MAERRLFRPAGSRDRKQREQERTDCGFHFNALPLIRSEWLICYQNKIDAVRGDAKRYKNT